MVLLEGIELSTSPLPRECSTTELQQRRGVNGAALVGGTPARRNPVDFWAVQQKLGGVRSGGPAQAPVFSPKPPVTD